MPFLSFLLSFILSSFRENFIFSPPITCFSSVFLNIIDHDLGPGILPTVKTSSCKMEGYAKIILVLDSLYIKHLKKRKKYRKREKRYRKREKG